MKISDTGVFRSVFQLLLILTITFSVYFGLRVKLQLLMHDEVLDFYYYNKRILQGDLKD